MSSGPALVRLSDGRIKHTTYYGSADSLLRSLHDTPGEAEDAFRGRLGVRDDECDCEPEPCEVWALYGPDFGWVAQACEHRVHRQFSPYREEDQMGNAYQESVPETRAPWAWVPEAMDDAWPTT